MEKTTRVGSFGINLWEWVVLDFLLILWVVLGVIPFKNKKFTAAISLSSRTSFEKGDLATQNSTNMATVAIF